MIFPEKTSDRNFQNEEETIDLTPYIKGVYIIEVKTEKDTVSKK